MTVGNPPQEWPHDRLDRQFFERIMEERQKFEIERQLRLDERFDALDKALKLQAEEYARRLHDLNGEYQRDRQRQTQYVSVDKWEATNDAEKLGREQALLRVNEKFEDYIKRYEVRQREVDLLLAAQAGAADEAKRAVEDSARKTNRNLALVSLALGVLVFGANLIPEIVK